MVMVVFVVSIGIDVLWFIFIYLIIINSNDYNDLAPWERGIQKCSCIVMIINFFIKVRPPHPDHSYCRLLLLRARSQGKRHRTSEPYGSTAPIISALNQINLCSLAR